MPAVLSGHGEGPPKALPELPQTLPKLPQGLPELPQSSQRCGSVSRGGSASKVAEINGRVVKYRGLGILYRIKRIKRIYRIKRIKRIYRIPGKWWQQVRLGAYLPHAPGVRMT